MVDGAPHVVCMLAEGSYFHGAAALSNSLVRNGFSGHIVVGYRGDLPRWGGPVSPAPGPAQAITPDTDIRFVEQHGGWNLGNQKPQFLLEAAQLHPDFASLWYFDCDIVLKTAWDSFARWTAETLLLVLDLAETYMPDNHVFRQEWQRLAASAGLGHRQVSGYFNSGCIGLPGGDLTLVHAWARLMQALAEGGGDMSVLTNRSGKPEYAKMDQDVMNAAIMAIDTPFNVLGVEAMDAFPSANIMGHAMVFAKPWRRNYVRDAIIGFQADPAHVSYWTYADGPIQSYTPSEWQAKQRMLKTARALRFLKRNSVVYW